MPLTPGEITASVNSRVVADPPRSSVSTPPAQSRLQRPADAVSAEAIADVVEHQACRENEGARIGDSLTGNVRRRAVHRFEDRRLPADVRAWRQTQSAHQARNEVGQDVAEQVGRDDDIESIRVDDELHGRGVDDPLVKVDPALEFLRDLLPDHSEQTLQYFRMFALWTSVTLFRPLRRA
jgi:hypothetical protein